MLEGLARDMDRLLDVCVACLIRESVTSQKYCHLLADGWRVVEHWISY